MGRLASTDSHPSEHMPKSIKPRLGINTAYRYSRFGDTASFSGAGVTVQSRFSPSIHSTTSSRLSEYKPEIQLVNNPDATNQLNTQVAPVNNYNPITYYPKLWYVTDPDDNTAVSVNALKERQGVKYKILKPNSEIKICVKPCVLVQTYKTAVTTGYGPKRMWVDVATAQGVPHCAGGARLSL